MLITNVASKIFYHVKFFRYSTKCVQSVYTVIKAACVGYARACEALKYDQTLTLSLKLVGMLPEPLTLILEGPPNPISHG